MFFVDSSVWIDLFRDAVTPQVEYLSRNIDSDIIVGDLVMTEVLQGIADDKSYRLTRQALFRFRIVAVSNQDVALSAAQHYRDLRTRGITVRKTIDTLIATRCIKEDWPLLYGDRDFEPFVEHLGLKSALLLH